MSAVIIILLCSLMCNGQSVPSSIPEHSSNFRFIGDTIKECSKISMSKCYDSIKRQHYYKIEQKCAQKIWTKNYGYAKIWWIDSFTKEWQNKWQMGYYWSYNISTHNKEVIFYDIKFKAQSIKQLNEL